MTDNSAHIVIDYYSDVLCIWAWIAQSRLEELNRHWSRQVSVRHRYVDIFGHSRSKISTQWGGNDGYEKFHAHVVASAAPFELIIHPKVWNQTRPRSSMQAHMVLKGVEIVAGDKILEIMAKQVRRKFFTEGRDIGQLHELLDIASELEVDIANLKEVLDSGQAMASLSEDLHHASTQGVKGSPTWVLNEGRQQLYGNVGYRILSANIDELLNNPADEASWC